MTEHFSVEQAEAWVLGTLPPEAASAVEAHANGCEACAALLSREAKLDAALMELARRTPPAVVRRRRAVGVAVAVAALAAGVLAVVSLQHAERPASPAPRVVHCSDPASSEACVSRAHFDGLLTVGPGEELAVPRYDTVPSGGPP